MIAMKMNDEKTNLSLNPNIKHKNQNRTQESKSKNMKCVNKSVKKSLL